MSSGETLLLRKKFGGLVLACRKYVYYSGTKHYSVTIQGIDDEEAAMDISRFAAERLNMGAAGRDG